MKKKRQGTFAALTMVLILVAASGCYVRTRVRVGPLQEESQTVEWDGEEPVRVEFDMGAGQLDVAGGAEGLLDADFAYNIAAYKPEVSYSDGRLVVRQPDAEGGASLLDFDDYRYEWYLRLAEDVPMVMTVDLGAGQAQLNLGSLSLTSLDANTGAGEVTIDLAGAASLSDLEIKIGAGDMTLDLRGDHSVDLDVRINGGVGRATIKLPRDVGVRVEIDGGLGAVNAAGLTKDGNTYTNDAYGQSDVTVRIDVNAGVGEINLALGE